MAVYNFNEEVFPNAEIVSVQGRPYLFSGVRIDRKTIPEGWYAYDVRDGESDGQFWQIQEFVMVDYWATIIGPEPMELDECGQYWCPADPDDPEYSSEGAFLDGYVSSVDEFIRDYDMYKEMCFPPVQEGGENA